MNFSKVFFDFLYVKNKIKDEDKTMVRSLNCVKNEWTIISSH